MESPIPFTGNTGNTATVALLESIGAAFNRHDLDAILAHFADDGVFDMPVGPEVHGKRVVGKAQIRAALEGIFAAVPDIHWASTHNWVSGDMGCSEWRRTGTTTGGKKLDWLGVDLFTFRNGQVIKKDSYFKVRD